MNNIPERNYKNDMARAGYNLMKGTVEMLKKQGREGETEDYVKNQIEVTDKIEREAEQNIKKLVTEYKKRSFLKIGKWVIVIILSLIALYWGIWTAIGVFIFGLIVVLVLS